MAGSSVCKATPDVNGCHTRPIRVLHVLWSGQIGGIERLVCDLATRQSIQGRIVPTVLLGSTEGPFAAALRSENIEVTAARLSSGWRIAPQAFWHVRDVVRRSDVVHLHGFSPSLALPLTLSGKPIVFTEHGVFGQGRTPTWCDRPKGALKRLFLHHRVAAIVANSQYTAMETASRYHLPPGRILTLYNGVAADMFKPDRAARDASPRTCHQLVVGSVGRLAAFKRFDRLLRAVALVDSPTVQALVVGGGPQEDELRRLATNLGIASRVEFVGPVQDVPRYLARMDLFVLPSEREPFGLALVEAMSAGLPAVVFADGGGPVEILNHLDCGRIVTDEQELALVISEAAERRVFPSRCSTCLLEESFGLSRMADAYMEVYCRALKAGE